jgi:hypothetical protein
MDKARRITLAEQRELEGGRQLPANFVPAAPHRRDPLPVASAAQGVGELVGGLMAESTTVYTADPITRAQGLLLKTSAATLALAFLTLAGMIMLSQFAFFLWLLLASLEWVVCFLALAVLDWREHPSAIRWRWTNGLIDIMQDEQRRRLDAQYGVEEEQPGGGGVVAYVWLVVALVALGLVYGVLTGVLV